LLVVTLGYYGGELTYGSKATATPAEYTTGEKIFTATCSACHPKGANAIMPNLPLVGSPKLADFDTFLAFVRDPKLPHGKSGPMPPIIPSKLKDKQLKELYDYIVKELAKGAKQ
jgi:mono/diheme cytochrome c family protein